MSEGWPDDDDDDSDDETARGNKRLSLYERYYRKIMKTVGRWLYRRQVAWWNLVGSTWPENVSHCRLQLNAIFPLNLCSLSERANSPAGERTTVCERERETAEWASRSISSQLAATASHPVATAAVAAAEMLFALKNETSSAWPRLDEGATVNG